MSVRDLGYRGYDGSRLPSSHNTWVLFRHGLRRAWSSWFVKLAVIFSWAPGLVGGVVVAFLRAQAVAMRLQLQQMPDLDPKKAEALSQLTKIGDGTWFHLFMKVQLWALVAFAVLGAGASVISQDLAARSFAFYFSKPVTPMQYLIGRVAAVSTIAFLLLAPFSLVFLGITAAGQEGDERLVTAGYALPVLIHAILCAVFVGLVSVAIGAISKSRALSMSIWAFVFIIPHGIALIVSGFTKNEWALLGSIPGLLSIVGDALFKVQTETTLWYYALPILVALGALSFWYSARRLSSFERAQVSG